MRDAALLALFERDRFAYHQWLYTQVETLAIRVFGRARVPRARTAAASLTNTLVAEDRLLERYLEELPDEPFADYVQSESRPRVEMAFMDACREDENLLVLRTQVLLSLSGIVITVTGFSGRAIAQTGDLARVLISAGILIVLSAALTAIGGVLKLRWLTQDIADDPLTTVTRALALRDAKSRSLGVAMILFGIGFACYCAAIAQLLMHPR